MKQKLSFKLLVIVLTVHIFSVQSKLLYFLSPEMKVKLPFTFTDLNEHAYLAMVFALSYSLATAFIIYMSEKKWLVLTYAVMDGLAVLLYYGDNTYKVTSVYFALYTFLLIGSVIFMRQTPTVLDKLHSMKDKGISVKDISNRLGISKSKIYKILKK